MESTEFCSLWKNELEHSRKTEVLGLVDRAFDELPAHIVNCENCRLALKERVNFLPRTLSGECRFVWEVIWFRASCLKPMESMTSEVAKVVAERFKKYAHDQKIPA